MPIADSDIYEIRAEEFRTNPLVLTMPLLQIYYITTFFTTHRSSRFRESFPSFLAKFHHSPLKHFALK